MLRAPPLRKTIFSFGTWQNWVRHFHAKGSLMAIASNRKHCFIIPIFNEFVIKSSLETAVIVEVVISSPWLLSSSSLVFIIRFSIHESNISWFGQIPQMLNVDVRAIINSLLKIKNNVWVYISRNQPFKKTILIFIKHVEHKF